MASSDDWPPRVGVYDLDYDIVQVLFEMEVSVSNRELLFWYVMEEFHRISKAFREKTENVYILRERHRRWQEYVGTEFGNWIETPDWDDLADADWINAENKSWSYEEFLYNDEPEWTLLGEDAEKAYALLEDIPAASFNADDAESVVELLLRKSPDVRSLYLVARDLSAIYVIRSDKYERHDDVHTAPGYGMHYFEYIGDAEKDGPYLTYVLPDYVVGEILEAKRLEEVECHNCGGVGECGR